MQVFSTLFPFLHNALHIFWGQDGHLRLHPGTLTQDLLLKAIYSFTAESLSVAYKHNKLYMLPFLMVQFLRFSGYMNPWEILMFLF